MYTEFTRELAEPRWAAAWNALFIELREPAAVSRAAPLPAWAASLAAPFQKGFADACCPRGFPAAFSIVAGAREGTLRVRCQERVQEWVYRMWARTAADADGVGCDCDAMHMGEGAERGRRREDERTSHVTRWYQRLYTPVSGREARGERHDLIHAHFAAHQTSLDCSIW